MHALKVLSLILLLLTPPLWAEEATPVPPADDETSGHYTEQEILDKAKGFFGDVSEGLAKAVRKVFEDQGEPTAYIAGEEASGAIGIGARYGRGTLEMASGQTRELFWQGPSIGFDLGGDASKVFTLIYQLNDIEQIYQRYPGVDGSYFFIAGAGVNYLRSGKVTLAPIRTGVGVRAGASIGYLHFTREKSWVPF